MVPRVNTDQNLVAGFPVFVRFSQTADVTIILYDNSKNYLVLLQVKFIGMWKAKFHFGKLLIGLVGAV